MAHNLKLDSAHDIIIGRGATRTSAFVPQLVKCRLLTNLGEWFLDPSLGLPWGTEVFVRGVNMSTVYNYIYDIIQRTNGVVTITSLVLTPNYKTRRLSVVYSVIVGEEQFTEEVIYGGS